MLYVFSKDSEHIVVPYKTVGMNDAAGVRLPEDYGVLASKKVGIVGCGSLGSRLPPAWLAAGWLTSSLLTMIS